MNKHGKAYGPQCAFMRPSDYVGIWYQEYSWKYKRKAIDVGRIYRILSERGFPMGDLPLYWPHIVRVNPATKSAEFEVDSKRLFGYSKKKCF